MKRKRYAKIAPVIIGDRKPAQIGMWLNILDIEVYAKMLISLIVLTVSLILVVTFGITKTMSKLIDKIDEAITHIADTHGDFTAVMMLEKAKDYAREAEKELESYQEENMEIDAELDWLKDFVKESFYNSGDGDIYYMFREETPHNEVYLRELLEEDDE